MSFRSLPFFSLAVLRRVCLKLINPFFFFLIPPIISSSRVQGLEESAADREGSLSSQRAQVCRVAPSFLCSRSLLSFSS